MYDGKIKLCTFSVLHGIYLQIDSDSELEENYGSVQAQKVKIWQKITVVR